MSSCFFTLIAAYNGRNFGQGPGTLSAVENALVLFMLGLLLGVLGMTALFVYLSWRQSKSNSQSGEAQEFLTKSQWNAGKTPPLTPSSSNGPADSKPWEKDGDWWKEEEER